MLSEEEVYNGCKNFLINNGYSVVAGQPPRGVDHLPVIEIKEDTGIKGSLSSYKPDMVAYKDDIFYIIECKPQYNLGDRMKLNEMLSNKVRKQKLYVELSQYQIFKKVNYKNNSETFCASLVGVLAYSGVAAIVPELNQIIVENWKGLATLI